MFWFIVGSILFLLAHRLAEGIVTSEGNRARRKFLFDMGTAGFFVFATAGLWVYALFSGSVILQRYGLLMFFATPIFLVAVLVFSYASYINYTDYGYDFEEEPS